MDETIQIVDRPNAPHRSKRSALRDALLATVASGKAVLIPLNGQQASTIRQAVHDICRRSNGGYRGCTTLQGDTVIAWLEPRT